jgi:hypothetical protein
MSKIWGASCWYLFHGLAARVKEDEFDVIKLELWNMITEVCHNLPCPDCKKHATAAMAKANKPFILKSKQNLEMFLFEFHNMVNARKYYKLFTMEEYESKYRNANLKNIIINFVNVFNQSSHNIKQPMENFHRRLFIEKFMAWIEKNKTKFY